MEKQKTLMEKMGFDDPELNEKHDEIVIWMSENLENYFPDKRTDEQIMINIDSYRIDQDLTELLKKRPKIKFDIIFEFPIINEIRLNKSIIGFIDLYVIVNYPVLRLINNQYNWIFNKTYIAFEIKTKIYSLGSLLRQLNLYKAYVNCKYYVVSPDNKYKNIIESQGYNFIDYKI